MARVRWCDAPAEHSLYIEPDLGGPEPTWVCEESGQSMAPLGQLRTRIEGGPS